MVANEDKLFDLVCCQTKASDFSLYRKYGIYVFRFFKDSLPYYVIVDDLIPCLSRLDKQPVPYLARCENPNLFWVSLVEKAFAKLHGRYFALSGGKVENALTDMIGVTTEELIIDPFEQTDCGRLFEALKVLSFNHCVIGCSLSTETNTLSKDLQAKQQNLENQAKAKGILSGHYYSLLDVR